MWGSPLQGSFLATRPGDGVLAQGGVSVRVPSGGHYLQPGVLGLLVREGWQELAASGCPPSLQCGTPGPAGTGWAVGGRRAQLALGGTVHGRDLSL